MAEGEKVVVTGGAWIVSAVAVVLVVGGIVAYMAVKREPQHPKGDRYVGPKTCASCHKEQAASWTDTHMAHAFELLKPGARAAEKKAAGLDPLANYTRDPYCLRCHTTGYGQVGGFKSIEKTPELAGVTCEACHGPGGRYARSSMEKEPGFQLSTALKEGLVYPPKAQVCAKCHNADSPFVGVDYEFDYKDRVQRGTHRHYKLKRKQG